MATGNYNMDGELYDRAIEECLILQEEFTCCPKHGTLIEYFTDCPDCIREENDQDSYIEGKYYD